MESSMVLTVFGVERKVMIHIFTQYIGVGIEFLDESNAEEKLVDVGNMEFS